MANIYRVLLGTNIALFFYSFVLTILVHCSAIDANAAKDYQNKANIARSALKLIEFCLKASDDKKPRK